MVLSKLRRHQCSVRAQPCALDPDTSRSKIVNGMPFSRQPCAIVRPTIPPPTIRTCIGGFSIDGADSTAFRVVRLARKEPISEVVPLIVSTTAKASQSRLSSQAALRVHRTCQARHREPVQSQGCRPQGNLEAALDGLMCEVKVSSGPKTRLCGKEPSGSVSKSGGGARE